MSVASSPSRFRSRSSSRFAIFTLRGKLSVFWVVLINGMSVWIVCRLLEERETISRSEERSQVSHENLTPT